MDRSSALHSVHRKDPMTVRKYIGARIRLCSGACLGLLGPLVCPKEYSAAHMLVKDGLWQCLLRYDRPSWVGFPNSRPGGQLAVRIAHCPIVRVWASKEGGTLVQA